MILGLFSISFFGYAFAIGKKSLRPRLIVINKDECFIKSADQPSTLRHWYVGTYAEAASVMMGHMHMDKNAFEFLIDEFGPQLETLKTLARKLRDVLFPIRDNAMLTATYAEPAHRDLMYKGMIGAYGVQRGDRHIARTS